MQSGRWFWNERWHKEDDDKAKMVLFRAGRCGQARFDAYPGILDADQTGNCMRS